MERAAARIISYVFHPLLMPTYAIYILLNIHTYFAMIIPEEVKWKLLGMIFLVTFIFPLIMSYLFLRVKVIKSIEMKSQEERVFPLIVTAMFFYLNYYLLNDLDISPLYSFFAIGATGLVVVTLIINFFWKISMHMIALGGLFGTLLGISLEFYANIPLLIFASIFVGGLTGFARLRLTAHAPAQIYTGFLSGAILMLALFLWI